MEMDIHPFGSISIWIDGSKVTRVIRSLVVDH